MDEVCHVVVLATSEVLLQPLTVASKSSEPPLQKGAAGDSTAAPPATAVPNSSFQASIVPLKVLTFAI